MKKIRHLAAILLIVLALLLGLLWVLLGSPTFRGHRIGVVSSLLSDLLQRPVEIDGDVSLAFFPDLAIVATGVRLPAEDLPGLDLAALERARLVLAPLQRLRGGLPLPEIEAQGLEVMLLEDDDGTTTWRDAVDVPEPAQERTTRETGLKKGTQTPQSRIGPPDEEGQADLMSFLGDRKITFSSMRVRAENRHTGFTFDFDLKELQVRQVERNGRMEAQVVSHGLVNGEIMSFRGAFPEAAPFQAQGQLGALELDISGERPSGAPSGAFDAQVGFETESLQDVLDVLRLKGELQGSGRATAKLRRERGYYDLEDIDVMLDMDDGKTARVAGKLSDVRKGPEIDLQIELDLVGRSPGADTAIFLREVKPEAIAMHVVGADGLIEIDRVDFETNAFDDEFREIGPFRVDRISRTSDGRLQLEGLTLAIGPEDTPYISAEGEVDSLLTFEGYTLAGKLDLPASLILATLRPELAGSYGRLIGRFGVDDLDGRPALALSDLRTADTDAWEAAFDLEVRDLSSMTGVHLDLHLGAPDGGAFLKAARLDPVNLGRFSYDLTAEGSERELSVSSAVGVGLSRLGADMMLRTSGAKPVLRGKVASKSIRMTDLRNAVLAAKELSRAKAVYSEMRLSERDRDATGDEFQPLVLPAPGATINDDLSGFQPLVLPDAPDVKDETASDGRGGEARDGDDHTDYQPLVLSEDADKLMLDDLVDPEKFARLVDAEIDIDIARISGQEGISSMKSGLEVKDGRLRFGPLRVSYGGDYADVRAALDFVRSPDWLRLTGQTGGWDFGKILDSLGAGIGAYGTLAGRFDLTGRRTSAPVFLDTMSGTATVEMRNGRIHTSLIDLAGLGVLPWLFTSELRRGYATIVCVRAPLRVNENWVLAGGYRYIEVDHEIDGNNFSFDQSGPLIGISYRF